MWKCQECGEDCEDQFDACWRCSSERLSSKQRPSDAGGRIGAGGAQSDISETSSVGLHSDKRCSGCGSSRVVPNAVLGDQGQYSDGTAKVTVFSNPNAFLFKGGARAKVAARLCCDCGKLDFYADGNLDALWAAHQDANG